MFTSPVTKNTPTDAAHSMGGYWTHVRNIG
jgi:hypothetical protein